MDQNSRNNFETRAQSIVQSILLALVFWIGYSVVSLRDSAVRQEFQNAQNQKDSQELRMEISALRTQVIAASLAAAQTATAAAATAATAAAVAEDRRMGNRAKR